MNLKNKGRRISLRNLFRYLLSRRISRKRILSGRLRGKIIVTSWFDYPAAILGYTERALLEWFYENVNPGDIWIDVGAHYGFTSIALCDIVGGNGRVFAFEPFLATAGCLSQTRYHNQFSQLMVFPLALAENEDFVTSKLPVSRGMLDSTMPDGGLTDLLMVTSLDWLWPKISDGLNRINGVKIDVQGMEFSVLTGMKSLIRDYKPKLIIEFHKGVNREEILHLLDDLGYARTGHSIETQNGSSDQYLDNHSYYFSPKR